MKIRGNEIIYENKKHRKTGRMGQFFHAVKEMQECVQTICMLTSV